MTSYLRQAINTRVTPQSEPIPGSAQVPNSAGGYSFALDRWGRLNRFLILGSEGGSYYATERELTLQNVSVVQECMAEDGPRVVTTVVDVITNDRAPKPDPALLVLAYCARKGDLDTRRAAFAALPKVVRTGTQLLHFVAFTQEFRGWGRGLRLAVSRWFLDRPEESLVYQVIKYQSRDKWAQRDLLRLAHPKPLTPTQQAILHWVVKGWESVGDEPHPVTELARIWAMENLKRTDDVQAAAGFVREYHIPREAIPTQFLTERAVWEALLPDLGMTALIRNLATLTRNETVNLKDERGRLLVQSIGARLQDAFELKKGHIHPIALLSALLTYKAGKSARGSGIWTPITSLIDALDSAFYTSFGAVQGSGRRLMLALDVSGSMDGGMIAGVPGLTPRIGAAAMALVTAASELDPLFVAFADASVFGGTGAYQTHMGPTGLLPLTISPRQRLDDVVHQMQRIPMGGTDCALPMLVALHNKIAVDAFIVYTDSETWAGSIHPVQALRQYREQMRIPAKLIVVGMVGNQFSIADPGDAGMMDCVGFDTATPNLISGFVRGEL